MSIITTRESFVANFETALQNAGMINGYVTSKSVILPMYWRGIVRDTNKTLYLVYNVYDSPETVASDNKPFIRTIYIYGTLFTRNGKTDEDYQILLNNIQKECEKTIPQITFMLGSEDVQMPTDPDSAIDYINFTAYQKRII